MSEDTENGNASHTGQVAQNSSLLKHYPQESSTPDNGSAEPNRAPQPSNGSAQSSLGDRGIDQSIDRSHKVEAGASTKESQSQSSPKNPTPTEPPISTMQGATVVDVNTKNQNPQDQTKKKRSTKPKKSKANLRRGKWTVEEEEYTTKIIQHFRTGLLSLPNGHTLRSYLAEKLNCDPMRITKKFSGASCLGKRVYNLCDRSQVSAHDLELANSELMALEQRYRMRIEHGSSLPLATHLSAFRKMGIPGNNGLDQATLMNPNYLFMKNTAGTVAPTGPLGLTSPSSAANIGVSPNYGGHQSNLPLAIIQSLAAQQQQQQQNERSNQFQNQLNHSYQLQNQFQNQQIHHQVGNNVAQLLSIQQTLNPNLLTSLINGQVSLNQPSVHMNDSTHQGLTQQQQSFFNQISNSSILPNLRQDQNAFGSNQIANILQQGRQQAIDQHPAKTTGEVAIEALAATYNRAAAMSSNLPLQHSVSGGTQPEDALAQNAQSALDATKVSQNPPTTTTTKKVRTQEEEDAGRTLLGFIRELQSNHQKAISVDMAASATTTSSIQNQTNSSKSTKDDTATTQSTSTTTTPNLSLSEKLLKRGFDISVYNSNSTGLVASTVPNNEALSGSSNAGGYSESSSSDGNQDQSGSDAEKELESAGPLRKRFRRS